MCWIAAFKIICPNLWNMETESSSKSTWIFSLFKLCDIFDSWTSQWTNKESFKNFFFDWHVLFANAKLLFLSILLIRRSQPLAGYRVGSIIILLELKLLWYNLLHQNNHTYSIATTIYHVRIIIVIINLNCWLAFFV